MNKLNAIPFLLLSTLSLTAVAEDYIVFSATGVDYTPGTMLVDDHVITLEEGQSLTLVSASGNFFDIDGPYSAVPAVDGTDAEKGVSDALKKLIAPKDAHEGDLGVTRSATDVLSFSQTYGWLPEPWILDVTKQGNQCVEKGRTVVLWKNDGEEVAFALAADGDYQVKTTWPAEVNKISAPENMPINDGQKYTFDVDGAAAEVTLHVIPAGLAPVPQAAWLDKVGCTAQAVAVLNDQDSL